MLLVLGEDGEATTPISELFGDRASNADWRLWRVRLTVIASAVVSVTLRQRRAAGGDPELTLPAGAGVLLRDVLVEDFSDINITGDAGTSVAVSATTWEPAL